MRVPHSRREDCQLDHSVLSSWLPRSSEATKKPESISMLVIVLISINRSQQPPPGKRLRRTLGSSVFSPLPGHGFLWSPSSLLHHVQEI